MTVALVVSKSTALIIIVWNTSFIKRGKEATISALKRENLRVFITIAVQLWLA